MACLVDVFTDSEPLVVEQAGRGLVLRVGKGPGRAAIHMEVATAEEIIARLQVATQAYRAAEREASTPTTRRAA